MFLSQSENKLCGAGYSAVNGQVCATNLKAQNGAQEETVRLNTAMAKPDVDDIQALLGKIYYLKHPSSRLLVLFADLWQIISVTTLHF